MKKLDPETRKQRRREAQLRWINKNREKNRAIGRAWYHKYGPWKKERAKKLLEAGNTNCPICGDLGEHVDHDHKTGAIRKVLCKRCNWGLGHFRDNPEFLRKAAQYLEEHTKKGVDADVRVLSEVSGRTGPIESAAAPVPAGVGVGKRNG